MKEWVASEEQILEQYCILLTMIGNKNVDRTEMISFYRQIINRFDYALMNRSNRIQHWKC